MSLLEKIRGFVGGESEGTGTVGDGEPGPIVSQAQDQTANEQDPHGQEENAGSSKKRHGCC